MGDGKPMAVWKDSFAIGIASVDREHQRFFELINAMHAAVLAGGSNARCRTTLQELVGYSAWHFRREEQLMVAAGYPDAASHGAEHEAFRRRLERLRADGAGSIAMLGFMTDWIVEHILGSDRAFGRWNSAQSGRLADPAPPRRLAG